PETIVRDVGDVRDVRRVRDVRDVGDVEGVRIVRVRARSASEAVRTHLALTEDSLIAIERGPHFEALEGWQDARVNGETVVQIRIFQRMKFRRA
ncbi:MAG: hypothetical protein ACC655_03135, partial [Rhodothermia bacterium]